MWSTCSEIYCNYIYIFFVIRIIPYYYTNIQNVRTYLLFFILLFAASAHAQTKTLQQKFVVNDTLFYAQEQETLFDSSIYYTDTIIRWMSIQEAEAAQKIVPKKIFVNIRATWCRWCRIQDSISYKNREIAHYINQNFYPVNFNAETKEIITFKGKQYVFTKEVSVFAHELTQYFLNGRLSYPGIVFLDENTTIINARNGYTEPDYLDFILNYYGSNSYKSMSLSDFDDNFEGKVPMR